MTPEYLEQLADLADPDNLWQRPALERLDMPPEKRMQLDAGVALRRYADHQRRLLELLGTGKSLLITPLSPNGTATKIVPTSVSHQCLLPSGGKSALGQLPEPRWKWQGKGGSRPYEDSYSADQMRDYAAAEVARAVAAERERWHELVRQLVACHDEPTCPAVDLAMNMLAGECCHEDDQV